MYVAEIWGDNDKHPDKAIACDTLTEARIKAIGLMTDMRDSVTITRTTQDRMYRVEEIVCHRADRFNERAGRFKVAYAYYIKKHTPKGPEYYEISKTTGKAIRKAYEVSGFF